MTYACVAYTCADICKGAECVHLCHETLIPQPSLLQHMCVAYAACMHMCVAAHMSSSMCFAANMLCSMCFAAHMLSSMIVLQHPPCACNVFSQPASLAASPMCIGACSITMTSIGLFVVSKLVFMASAVICTSGSELETMRWPI